MDVEFWIVVLSGALALSVPVVLAAVGEIFLERTGGFNVGIEGMMLVGAACGVIGSAWGGFWVGLSAGVLAGAVLGILLGLATVYGGADIVIIGIAIGLAGTALSTFFYQLLAPGGGTNTTAPVQPPLNAPWLESIPVVGPILDRAGLLFFITIGLVLLAWLVLSQTRFGVRIRAVGDDDALAATRGVRVDRYRIATAVIAGAFAGLGGAAVPLANIGTFTPGMTGGAGFIALAVVIIGRGNPLGALGGALLFAFFDRLAILAQTQGLGLPLELYQALPYVVTLLILCLAAAQRTALARRRALAAAGT